MIAVGNNFIVACLSDGVVRAWGGDNAYGQLNIPNEVGEVSHISAGNGFVVVTRTDGTLIAWGRNDKHQCEIPNGLVNILYTVCGDDFVYAVTREGGLICWGASRHNQLIVPDDVLVKGVKLLSIQNTTVAIETNQESLTSFNTE